MKTKILSIIIVISAALTLTACGEDKESSAPANSSSTSSEKTSSQSSDKGSDDTPNSAPASSSAPTNGNAPDVSGRHFYKTVVVYGGDGGAHSIYPGADNAASGYMMYEAALVIDYDTTTGARERTRFCMYYVGDDQHPDEEQESRLRQLMYAGLFSDMSYTEETFYLGYGEVKDKMNVLIWELPDDFDCLAFAQELETPFFSNSNTAVPQDIDGFIYRQLYRDFENSYIMESLHQPTPYFGSNFYRNGVGELTICWYDTAWNIEMYDPMYDIEEKYSNVGYVKPAPAGEWDPADYGSTSFNTGGGYTGTYKYEDCIIPY